MPPFICTIPDDIPLHPGAPDYVDQGQELGGCVTISSFKLIAEHQRVMAERARPVNTKNKIRDQNMSKNKETPRAQQVYHPRSKITRKAWAVKNDAKESQDTTATNVSVIKHVYLLHIIESTDSQAASKQVELLSSQTDDNAIVNEKAAAESHDAYLSHSVPPTPSVSSAPLSPSSIRVNALHDDIVHGSENEKATPSVTDIASDPVSAEILVPPLSTSSQSPIIPDPDDKSTLGGVRDPRTGAKVILLNVISPAPDAAEETVLQPVSAPVQSSANTLKSKSEKAFLGKENQAELLSVSGTVVPSRRSQRILKRKRGRNEGIDIVDR